MGYYYLESLEKMSFEYHPNYFFKMSSRVFSEFLSIFETGDVDKMRELEDFLWMTWDGYDMDERNFLNDCLIRSMLSTESFETNLALLC